MNRRCQQRQQSITTNTTEMTNLQNGELIHNATTSVIEASSLDHKEAAQQAGSALERLEARSSSELRCRNDHQNTGVNQ